MKSKIFGKKVFLSLALGFFATTGVFAAPAPFSDVPMNHWAHEAVRYLAEKGYIQGFPDGMYKGQRPVTRYGLAVIIANLSAALEQNFKGSGDMVTKKDLLTLEKLTVEFADELALMGVKVGSLEGQMTEVKGDVKNLKTDVGAIQEHIKRGGGGGPVRWAGGDFGVRYHNFRTDSENALALADSRNHEVDAEIRFHLDIMIDEAVEGHAVVKGGNIDASNAFGNGQGTERGLSTIGEWEFQELYISHKELFGIEGTTIIGRRYIALGNKMALATEMDGIRFQRRFLDAVDVDIFWYNNRADTRHQMAGLNLEYDFSERHHGYLYYFANGAENTNGAAVKNTSNIADDGYGGLGLNGSFSNHWDYFAAGLVTTEDKDGIGSKSDYTGVEWLVGLKYFPNKEWDFRLQAAGGNDELNDPTAGRGGKLVNTDHRYYDDAPGPYEDVARAFMGFAGSGPLEAAQIRPINSIAWAVESSWHYNEWHDFRLAYDSWFTSDESTTNRATPFATYAGSGAGITDYLLGLITFEYRFKSSENGRMRLGLSYMDFDNRTPLAGNLGDFSQTNLYGEFSYRF